jgi:hypothetical protein
MNIPQKTQNLTNSFKSGNIYINYSRESIIALRQIGDEMHNENRGFLSTLETYLDMLINLAAFLIAYVITVLIEGEAALTFDSPYTTSIIFVNVLLSSLFDSIFASLIS